MEEINNRSIYPTYVWVLSASFIFESFAQILPILKPCLVFLKSICPSIYLVHYLISDVELITWYFKNCVNLYINLMHNRVQKKYLDKRLKDTFWISYVNGDNPIHRNIFTFFLHFYILHDFINYLHHSNHFITVTKQFSSCWHYHFLLQCTNDW